MIRWNITIPEKTDRAVRKRVLDLTVSEIKGRNVEYDQQQILELIEQEVDAVHADRS